MMGSNEQSFIDRYIEETPIIPPYKILRAELDGMIKWHQIIGSTPQPWFDAPTLAIKISKAMNHRAAMEAPWVSTVADRLPTKQRKTFYEFG